MKQEAMELALEALEMYLNMDTMDESYLLEIDLAPKAITALREALAEPEQEPVANYCKECLTYNGHHEGCSHYTTPPQRTWVGLTNKDITQVINLMPKKMKGFMVDWDLYEFSKAYEAKLKQKNGFAEEKNT